MEEQSAALHCVGQVFCCWWWGSVGNGRAVEVRKANCTQGCGALGWGVGVSGSLLHWEEGKLLAKAGAKAAGVKCSWEQTKVVPAPCHFGGRDATTLWSCATGALMLSPAYSTLECHRFSLQALPCTTICVSVPHAFLTVP
jgi:hypothetical protein